MELITENYLDVTLLEPRLKHPTIFKRFDALAEGESLTIHNDHDPKPLYYQMLGERGNIFTWEYLEQGPEIWNVKITKRTSTNSGETLGTLAAADTRKAQVFKKYGLDFCCGGKKTVQEACAEKSIDPALVENALRLAAQEPKSRDLPYNEWPLDFLADYIVNTHHLYIRNTMPDIVHYAKKVMHVHGHSHPELTEICEKVELIHAELSAHMAKEEKILFPYIKELMSVSTNVQPFYAAHFGTVQNPVHMMEMEHTLVGGLLEEIRALSSGYSLPQDACASYSLLYRLLDEFEDDLHMHIHLENNILFPKAIALEKQLKP